MAHLQEIIDPIPVIKVVWVLHNECEFVILQDADLRGGATAREGAIVGVAINGNAQMTAEWEENQEGQLLRKRCWQALSP